MATLSYAQALQDALNAGFSSTVAPIFVAIEEAESNLVTTAYNPGYPADKADPAGDVEKSYGIAQINVAAHPNVTIAQAEDPVFADAYSYGLSQGGTNFSAWGTFDSGAYKQYLTNPITTPGGGNPISGIVGATGDGITSGVGSIISSLVGTPLEWLADLLKGIGVPSIKDLSYRTLFIIGGAILMLVGIILFVGPGISNAASQAAPAAGLVLA